MKNSEGAVNQKKKYCNPKPLCLQIYDHNDDDDNGDKDNDDDDDDNGDKDDDDDDDDNGDKDDDDDNRSMILFDRKVLETIFAGLQQLDAQWPEPVSFTFHSALRELNTEPAMHVDASYQVSVHMAKQFQRRRFFQKSTNQKQELGCGGHVC